MTAGDSTRIDEKAARLDAHWRTIMQGSMKLASLDWDGARAAIVKTARPAGDAGR